MKEVAISVRARLLNHSRASGGTFNKLLEQYATGRFLWRLGESCHRERFILKGAQLFRLWDSELRENHELITVGVYRRIRHPMYASIWLWAFAQGMLLQNWFAGWSVVPAFAAMYFLRTPREERLMCEEFGDQYRAYMRQTGRLFPRWKS